MTDNFDYQDGNAVAGALAEVFAADVAAAEAICRHCGQRGRVAELRVYRGPGLVARCPSCEEPVLRFVRTPTSAHLDLRGAVSLVVRLPGEA
jgi:NAD-dependent SIR2 family protein deacetylase